MKIYKEYGSKEKLFEMMNGVNKTTLNETFDVPNEKDEKYLDKAVPKGGKAQANKYDHGYDYPVNKDIKTDHESLDKVVDESKVGDWFKKQVDDIKMGMGDVPSTSRHRKDAMAGPGGVAGAELAKLKHQELGGDKDNNKTNEAEDVENGEDEILKGGLADDMEPTDFDPKEVSKGIEVEMEHTNDPHAALEIALDHLVEIPDYYTRLDVMEKHGEEDNEVTSDEVVPDADVDMDVEVEDDPDKEIYEQIKRNRKLSYL